MSSTELGEYPPAQHVLRDLRLTVEHRPDTSVAWMPASPHLCADSGALRAGALATLVDVVGGGLAARAARPGWIATADLTLHALPREVRGNVEARARVLRRGRTTVVLEVTLHDAADVPLGLATMSFAVLVRREGNPTMDQLDTVSRMTIDGDGPGLATPLRERIGLTAAADAPGEIELPYSDYVRNTLGAIQGGMMAAAVDAAAEGALRAASGSAVETIDLQITYLALAKIGPVRSRTTVLAATPTLGNAHVELVDSGAGDRVTTLGRVLAAVPW